MSGFLLTDEEKRRFLQWLELQAESSRAMLKQFESLPSAVAEAMTAREKRDLAGFLTVAHYLRSGESMTVGAPTTNDSG